MVVAAVAAVVAAAAAVVDVAVEKAAVAAVAAVVVVVGGNALVEEAISRVVMDTVGAVNGGGAQGELKTAESRQSQRQTLLLPCCQRLQSLHSLAPLVLPR